MDHIAPELVAKIKAEWVAHFYRNTHMNPEGQELVGIASAATLSDPVGHSHLFSPLMEKMAGSIPEQLQSINGEYSKFRLELPDNPLTVTTIVMEHEDGRLVPMVSR